MGKFTFMFVLTITITSISLSHCHIGIGMEDRVYRIRSMKDGLYASAGSTNGMGLGEVTTEKWDNFREQRWDLKAVDMTRNEYWIFAQENSFNKVSARISKGKRVQHNSELVAVTFGRYLIRSAYTEICLDNPGYGLRTAYVPCDPNDLSQHWEFDLLTSQ